MAKALPKLSEKKRKQPSAVPESIDTTPATDLPSASSAKTVILICAALFAIVMTVFFQTMRNDFLSWYGDDPLYVTENPNVNSGLTAENLRWAFTGMDRSNWHPLTWISHMVDCQIYGLKPWGHHLTSVLFHAANAVLLFVVLRQMTSAIWRSFAVALLFAIHPLRVESVAWVSERKDVLSAFFGLIAVWCYVLYAQKFKVQGSKFKVSYAFALLFFALSLMSKAMLVTLPFVLLLLDYWPFRRVTGDGWHMTRSFGRLLLEKIPFFILTGMACAMTFLTQSKWSVIRTLNDYPFDLRLKNVVVSYARYLGKMIWPKELSSFYPYPSSLVLPVVLACVVLLVVISFVAVRLYARKPYLIIGWLWFVGAFVPMIGFVQTCDQSIAIRFTYFPMIGILFCVVWMIADWIKPAPQRTSISTVLMVAVSLPLIAVTQREISHYKDGVALWSHNLEVTGENGIARFALGLSLDKQGRTKEAIKELETFLAIYPYRSDARFNLANMYQNEGRTADAIAAFKEALKYSPGSIDIHQNLATLLVNIGRGQDAIVHYQEILKQTNDANVHNDLGTVLASDQQLDKAIEHFKAAVKAKPDHAQAHSNLGGVLIEKRLFDEAIPYLQEALRLNPNDAQARRDLDTLLSLKK